MSDATDMLAELEVEVQAHGRQVTFTTYTGSYDRTTRINTRTPTEHEDVWVFPPYTYTRAFPADSQAVTATNVIVPNLELPFTPNAGVKMTDGTEYWTVEQAVRHEMDNVVVAWELRLARGSAP